MQLFTCFFFFFVLPVFWNHSSLDSNPVVVVNFSLCLKSSDIHGKLTRQTGNDEKAIHTVRRYTVSLKARKGTASNCPVEHILKTECRYVLLATKSAISRNVYRAIYWTYFIFYNTNTTLCVLVNLQIYFYRLDFYMGSSKDPVSKFWSWRIDNYR